MNAAEIAVRIEAEMLQNLARLLFEGNAGDAEWQFQKLRQIGILSEMNAQSVRKHREELIKAVREEIEYKAFERATMIDKASKGSGRLVSDVLAPRADPALIAVIRQWESSALRVIDASQAMAVQGASESFRSAIVKAALKADMGVAGRQAVAEAVDELAESGLEVVLDKNSKKWSLEGYVSTTVRSSATNAAVQVQWERMDELGEDLIEISSHLGARPKCAPYQGRVFSRSGASKSHPPLSSTSYGEPDGLFGINCRHVAYPYFPGTEKTFRPYAKERNEKEYAEEQRQRAIERSLRKAKLSLSLAEQGGDAKTVQRIKDKIAEREASMREFIEATGRKRQFARERVRGASA